MTPGRDKRQYRVTPELIAFHAAKARQLRRETFKSAWCFLWTWLTQMTVRRRG